MSKDHEKFMTAAATLVFPEPMSGCWIWMGHVNPDGYGMHRYKRAHRLAYEAAIGPIPQGMVIDHRCRVRCCVNPAHMEAVTNTENVLRGVGVTAVNAEKTHCVKGHALTAQNTRLRIRDGKIRRSCRTCQNAMNLAYYYRRVRRVAFKAEELRP